VRPNETFRLCHSRWSSAKRIYLAAIIQRTDPPADLKLCSAQQPRKRDRIELACHSLDTVCRERFTSELKERLEIPSTDLATAADDTMTSLETTARDLRRFDAAASKVPRGRRPVRVSRSSSQKPSALLDEPGARIFFRRA
jgi:hypothetical protein